jgi:hypothetical protein
MGSKETRRIPKHACTGRLVIVALSAQPPGVNELCVCVYRQAVGWDVNLSLESGRGRNSFAKFFEIQTVLRYKIRESSTLLWHYIGERSLNHIQWRKMNFKERFSVPFLISDYPLTSMCFHYRIASEETDQVTKPRLHQEVS